jgi:hypothetical protein
VYKARGFSLIYSFSWGIYILRLSALPHNKLEHRHEQANGLYVNRTSGGDCYHRIIDGDIDAGTITGKEAGKSNCLSV